MSRINPLQIPKRLSPVLSRFMGAETAPRTEVTKQLWTHIKANDLQNPENKREILNDSTLEEIFQTPKMTMFEMPKLLNDHIYKD